MCHATDDMPSAEKIPRPFVKIRCRVANADDENSKDRFEKLVWSNYESGHESSMHPYHPRDDDMDVMINCHLCTLVNRHGTGRSVPIVITKDINDAIDWPAPKCLHAIGGSTRYRWQRERLENAELKSSLAGPVQFITVDPGRQYITGSFEPDDTDWYAQAYGE